MSPNAEVGAIRRGVPLSDDSIFLRKPVAEESEGATAGRNVVAGLILKTLVVFLSLVGFYLLVLTGKESPFFSIERVEVRGVVRLDAGKVREVVAKEFPANLNAVDIGRLKARLEKISWVKTAVVRKLYPDALLIEIAERVPVGVACMDRMWLFDGEGVILEEFKRGAGLKDQPLLSGLQAAKDGLLPEENRERISVFIRYLNELQTLGGGLAAGISEVDISDKSDIVIVPMDGVPRVHLGDAGLAARTRRFFAMLPRIREENAAIAEVDMRSDGMMVLRPAGRGSR